MASSSSNIGMYVQPKTGDVHVTGNVLPSSCNVYDLGSAGARWRDLYLSGNTIDLGGTFIKRDESGGGLKVEGDNGSNVDTSVRNLHASGYVNINGTHLERHVTGPLMVKTPSGDPESGMFKHAYVDGTAQASNVAVLTGSSTAPALSVTQKSAHAQPIADFYGGETLALRVAQGGNVGIGVASPSERLHVDGNILTTGTLIASNLEIIGEYVTLNTVTSNTEQIVVTNAGTGPALKVTQTGANSIAEFYDDNDALALKIADGGNVGIGTTSPTEKLYVQGTVQATAFSGSGASLTALNANNVSSGTLAVERGGTGRTSYVIGDLLYASGTTTLSNLADVATGSALISGGANAAPSWGKVGLTTHVSGTLGVTNGGTGSNTLSANKVLVGNGTSAVLQPSDLHWDNTNSWLGIGTTNPTQKLHVVGNILSTGNIDAGTQFLGQASDTVSAPSFSWKGDTDVGIYHPSTNTLGVVTNGVERMRVDSNGNVGIGTSNPLANTHIYHTGTGDAFRVDDEASDTTPFVINEAGNVGMGTTVPLAKLHITQNGLLNNNIFSQYLGNGPASQVSYVTLCSIEARRSVLIGKIYGTRGGNTGLGNTAYANITVAIGISGTTSAAFNSTFIGTEALYFKLVSLSYNSKSYIAIGLYPGTERGLTGGIYFEGTSSHPSEIQLITDLTSVSNIADYVQNEVAKTTFEGNVGIGTTNPQALVDIKGSVLIGETSSAGLYNSNAVLHIRKNIRPHLLFENINQNTGAILVNGTAGFVYGIQNGGHSFKTGCSYNQDFTLTGTERMRITADGNVGIGTTSPTEKLHIEGNLYTSGDITGLSDVRYKTDIAKIENALDKVKAITGYTFAMKDDEHQIRHSGVLAQEVELVLPEVVSHHSDGKKTVAYGNMVGLLIEAIKEQSRLIDELRERICEPL